MRRVIAVGVAAILSCLPVCASISRIQATSATATTASITSTTAGDLIVVCAFRTTSATPPTPPAGYTTIDLSPGVSASSMVSAYRISPGSETTIGTWTNASSVAVIVFRGAFGIGNSIANSGNLQTTINYAALTFLNADSTSWGVGCGGNKTSAAATAPTGMTLITNQATLVMSDTEAGASSFTTSTVGGNASNPWRTDVIEITQHSSKVCTLSLLGVGPC